MPKAIKQFIDQNSAYLAWAVALIASLGSLGFSQILHYTPCVLCWYQRIAMYPLVVILAVGILTADKKLANYVLPLSIGGGVIAFYHSLLQWGILPEKIAPCVAGVSCLTKYINWFGFITIPFMSLIAFVIITALMLNYKKAHA